MGIEGGAGCSALLKTMLACWHGGGMHRGGGSEQYFGICLGQYPRLSLKLCPYETRPGNLKEADFQVQLRKEAGMVRPCMVPCRGANTKQVDHVVSLQ